ncbi:MAG: hypothetical protein IT441_11140 [Phycisphaeraceae bacterium]|nr:hypothetical protein [Phycisphaeraceae bacterium]
MGCSTKLAPTSQAHFPPSSWLIHALLTVGMIAWLGLSPTLAQTLATEDVSADPTSAVDPTNPEQVLMLESAPQDHRGGFVSGVLLRELGRQAVLIAARDELGLPTRDASLREPFLQIAQPVETSQPSANQPAAPAAQTRNRPLNLYLVFSSGSHYRVLLSRKDANGEFGYLRMMSLVLEPSEQVVEWPAILAASEEASRTTMPRQLRLMGFVDRRLLADDQTPPPNPDLLLAPMSFVEQFQAVRLLHRWRAQYPQSPTLLGALARAYANLGLLTEHFWTNTHKVFKARSLLYAQRYVATCPQDPQAWCTRAYAMALTGLGGLAEKDLDHAVSLAGDEASLPAYVSTLRAMIAEDYQQLLTIAQTPSPQAGLAGVLAVWVVQAEGDNTLTNSVAQTALQAAPLADVVAYAMFRQEGVSSGHFATKAGPDMLANALRASLPAFDDLPARVRAIVQNPRLNLEKVTLRGRIAAALFDASKSLADPSEPSWAVLASMIDDDQFVHAYHRLVFLRYIWGVEFQQASNLVAEARPALKRHPLERIIESFQVADRNYPQFADNFSRITTTDVSLAVHPLFSRHAYDLTYTTRFQPVRDLRDAMYDNNDLIERDVSQTFLDWNDPQRELDLAGQLDSINPHTPLAAATRVRRDWETSQDRLADWRERFGDHPVFVRAVVPKLLEEGRRDEAVETLDHLRSVTPSTWPLEQLAKIHLEDGDEAAWLASMKAILDLPDAGLKHAYVNITIADHYMQQGQFDVALPYAEQAGESWSGESMDYASACNEAVGNMDRAELWAQRTTERYDSVPCRWYFFCWRTGMGDLDDARIAVENVLGANSSTQGLSSDSISGAWFLILEGRSEQGQAMLDRFLRNNDHFWAGLQAILLAHDAGRTDQRDRTLAELRKRAERSDRSEYWMAMLDMVEAVWSNPQAVPELARKMRARNTAPYRERELQCLTATGWTLKRTGHDQEALECWTSVLKSPYTSQIGYVWTWWLAEQDKIDPRAMRQWPGDLQSARTQPSDAATDDQFMQEDVEPGETTHGAPGRAPVAPR